MIGISQYQKDGDMVKTIQIMVSIVILMSVLSVFGGDIKTDKIKKAVKGITWYNTSAFGISAGGKSIFIDVNKNIGKGKADILLFTHDHDDHISTSGIADILTDSTVIIAPAVCLENRNLKKYNKKMISLKPLDSTVVYGVVIRAVYAYNIKKQWHSRSDNFVGYVITADGVTYYHTGDTERIPEMQSIACDIIMLPLGQKYTLNSVDEAADVIADVKATVAIPMHWGEHEGTAADVAKFQKLMDDKKIMCVVKKAK
jgi:L-ascorbate metabolism protein UlaG (beta-lactamase superfamily)